MIREYDEKANLYLVEKDGDFFSYEKSVNTLHLYQINNFLSDKELPGLNSNNLIRNSGGTIVCKNNKGNIIWLINIDHQQNEKMKLYLSNELLETVSTIINVIKRDLKLNTILK